MSDRYNKLKKLLKELFQLDQPDLDFGLYRIMHAKSGEVTAFLDNDLLPQVKQAFALYQPADKAALEQELAQAIEQTRSLGVDPDTVPKVKDLREKLANTAVDIASLEAEVYDHLYSFFRRYYSEGDFLSKRVYKEGVYAIPYEGEEVTLHWANKDQYYIKTSEYLRDYCIRLRPDDAANPMRVHFRLADAAEGEHGNVKAAEGKDRVFVLAATGESGHDFLSLEDGPQGPELSIRFEYRPATLTDWPAEVREGKTKPPTQKDMTAFAVARVLAGAADLFGPWITELQKPHATVSGDAADYSRLEGHLKRYTARNTFDYFIHKDLGTFLRRELDFYIKNEVMHLDDIENEKAPRVEQYLSKIRVIRRIAGKIIEFLAQLEDFQKKLWLKKKFVVETQWCVRVGCIPEKFYAEIVANDAQREEWVSLYAIDEIERDLTTVGYTVPLKPAFLKAHPTLVVDTRHFDAAFTAGLLEALGDVEEQTDGVLFQSENFQALSLIQSRLASSVDCIYIDPPYNTGQDGFVYKDSYQSASWASMINSRLQLAHHLLKPTGVLFSSINEIERLSLEWQMKSVFGPMNRVEEIIWVRDTVSNNAPAYSTNHEYVEVFARNRTAIEASGCAFRETKPGFADVMQVVATLQPSYPPISDVEAALSALYANHKKAHLADAHSRGESSEDAQKSDPWKGLYPYKRVEYRDTGGRYVPEAKARDVQATIWVWREVEPSMPSGKQASSTKDPTSENYRFYSPPHPDTGMPCRPPKRGWAFPQRAIANRPSFEGYCEDARIVFKEGAIPQLKYFLHEVETVVATSVVRQYADGDPRLEALFGRKALFDNPKPPGLISRFVRQTTGFDAAVLDFFAGSGTTGESVIETNRGDDKRRRFFLVEGGLYSASLIAPRLKKVTFTPEWKDGKPKRLATPEEADRSPRIMKIVRLESYEDTLNNLDIRRSDTQKSLLDEPAAKGDGKLREQYLLKYMLDVETRGSQSLLNVAAFRDPTAYRLSVKRPGSDESREVCVDLLETFNWLIGLTVEAIAAPQAFSASFERDAENRLQLKGGRIKADPSGPFWFRRVEGKLPDGRKALVVWRKLGDDLEQANLVLDFFLTDKLKISTKDFEFDVIYVNGSNNLENLKAPDDTWKVRLLEEEFHRLMFATEDV